jgi:hypothetical protein
LCSNSFFEDACLCDFLFVYFLELLLSLPSAISVTDASFLDFFLLQVGFFIFVICFML